MSLLSNEQNIYLFNIKKEKTNILHLIKKKERFDNIIEKKVYIYKLKCCLNKVNIRGRKT